MSEQTQQKPSHGRWLIIAAAVVAVLITAFLLTESSVNRKVEEAVKSFRQSLPEEVTFEAGSVEATLLGGQAVLRDVQFTIKNQNPALPISSLDYTAKEVRLDVEPKGETVIIPGVHMANITMTDLPVPENSSLSSGTINIGSFSASTRDGNLLDIDLANLTGLPPLSYKISDLVTDIRLSGDAPGLQSLKVTIDTLAFEAETPENMDMSLVGLSISSDGADDSAIDYTHDGFSLQGLNLLAVKAYADFMNAMVNEQASGYAATPKNQPDHQKNPMKALMGFFGMEKFQSGKERGRITLPPNGYFQSADEATPMVIDYYSDGVTLDNLRRINGIVVESDFSVKGFGFSGLSTLVMVGPGFAGLQLDSIVVDMESRNRYDEESKIANATSSMTIRNYLSLEVKQSATIDYSGAWLDEMITLATPPFDSKEDSFGHQWGEITQFYEEVTDGDITLRLTDKSGLKKIVQFAAGVTNMSEQDLRVQAAQTATQYLSLMIPDDPSLEQKIENFLGSDGQSLAIRIKMREGVGLDKLLNPPINPQTGLPDLDGLATVDISN